MARVRNSNATSKEKQSGKRPEKKDILVGWEIPAMPDDLGISEWTKRRQKHEAGNGVSKKAAHRDYEPYLCHVSKRCSAIEDIHAFLESSLGEELRPRTRPRKDLNNNGNDAARTSNRNNQIASSRSTENSSNCNGSNSVKVSQANSSNTQEYPAKYCQNGTNGLDKSVQFQVGSSEHLHQLTTSESADGSSETQIFSDKSVLLRTDSDTDVTWRSPALESRKYASESSTSKENPARVITSTRDSGTDTTEIIKPSVKLFYSQSNIVLKSPYEEQTVEEDYDSGASPTHDESAYHMIHRPLLGNYNLANRGLHSKSTGSIDTMRREPTEPPAVMGSMSVASFKTYKNAHHPDTKASAQKVALILHNMSNLLQKQTNDTRVISSSRANKLLDDDSAQVKSGAANAKKMNGLINLNLDADLPPRSTSNDRFNAFSTVQSATGERPGTRSKTSAHVNNRGAKGFAFSDLLPMVDTSLKGLLANGNLANTNAGTAGSRMDNGDTQNVSPALGYDMNSRDLYQWETKQVPDSQDPFGSIMGPPAFRPPANKTPLHRARETTHKRLTGPGEEEPATSEVRWQSSSKGLFSSRTERKSAPTRTNTGLQTKNGVSGREECLLPEIAPENSVSQQVSARSESGGTSNKKKPKSKLMDSIRKSTSVCDFRASTRPGEDLQRQSNFVK